MRTRRPPATISSPLKKRSVLIHGHPTSVSLEAAFWSALAQVARQKSMTVPRMIEMVDLARQGNNLSSALRLFVLAEAKAGRLPSRRMNVVRSTDKGE